jgi:hypothetical protein
MRRERYNLEEQVGGLIDHGERRVRRHEPAPAAVSDPVEPERYTLTTSGPVSIRAVRAASAPAHRRVA